MSQSLQLRVVFHPDGSDVVAAPRKNGVIIWPLPNTRSSSLKAKNGIKVKNVTRHLPSNAYLPLLKISPIPAAQPCPRSNPSIVCSRTVNSATHRVNTTVL